MVNHTWCTAWTQPCAACDVSHSVPPFSPIADKSLAAVIRRLRQERHESQEEVAHGAGLTTGSYVRIELGQASPAWVTVRGIAEALDLSLVELAKAIEREER